MQARSLPAALVRGNTLLVALLGAAVIAGCAQLRVPMWPVPMTMQPFAVLLVAGSCDRRAALGAVAAYLLAGLAGLPVLAGGASGLGGPTAGYLLSYLVVAAVLPGLRLRHPLALLGGLVAAMAVIYLCGATWLAVWLGSGAEAIRAGVLPFIPGDAVKVLLALSCLLGLRRRAA